MNRAIIYAMIGTLVVMGVVFGAGPIQRRFRELRSDQALIRADTGDVMASATYQRFKARRDALAAMRSALLAMAVSESMFVADSGRPTIFFLGQYSFPNDRSNLGPTVEIQRDRWIAKIGNVHTSMQCTMTAMLDTVTWRYHPGVPVCAEWTAQDSLAIANDTAHRHGDIPAPQAPPPPVVQHKRLDWGPVNNTPPRMPVIRQGTCQGEGCAISGTWAACSTLVARADKRLDAASVFTIHPRERFTAVTTDLHVLEPGIVVFRRPFTITIPIDEAGLVDITFMPADTLFVLNYIGEGEVVWRYRGSTMVGDMFWDPRESPAASDSFGLARPAKTVWWVRVRNATGHEGWIVGDYTKMATGGYMDEIERCAANRP
jgi:hypothetical protein